MNFHEEFLLLGILDTRLGNKTPLEITSDPIAVSVVVNAVISDRLVEKWREGHGGVGSSPVVGGEGCR